MDEPGDTRQDGALSGAALRPRAGILSPVGSPGFHRALLDSMTEGVSLSTEDGTIV
jgi:hypothetical protein